MKVKEAFLDDVLLLEVDQTKSDREIIMSYGPADFEQIGLNVAFVQDNISMSKLNVLRGLHYQVNKPQGKLLQILSGSIQDVVVDLRLSSNNFGKHVSIHLDSKDNNFLWIPPGYAHGFLALENDTKIMYQLTEYRFIEFERVLLWSDYDLSINWPSNIDFILSEKDMKGEKFINCEYF